MPGCWMLKGLEGSGGGDGGIGMDARWEEGIGRTSHTLELQELGRFSSKYTDAMYFQKLEGLDNNSHMSLALIPFLSHSDVKSTSCCSTYVHCGKYRSCKSSQRCICVTSVPV